MDSFQIHLSLVFLSRVLYEVAPDSEIMDFFDEQLLATDKNWEITNDGAATYTISEDKKQLQLRLKIM